MQNTFLKHINIFDREKKYRFIKNSSFSFFSIHPSNIKKENVIQEVMNLGCFTGDILSIQGEIKSPIEVIIDREDLTIQEGYLLKVKLPATEIQCLTVDKKEIEGMIQKKDIEKL